MEFDGSPESHPPFAKFGKILPSPTMDEPRKLQQRIPIMPLWGLICLLALIVDFDVDLAISRWCHGTAATNAWPWANAAFCRFLADFGHIPGILLGVFGIVMMVSSLRKPILVDRLRCGMFLLLTLLIGPGLLVNVVVKDCWNRARPREIAEFGGQEQFTEFAMPGFSLHSKSFPSGHASIAFFLLTPAFVFWRQGFRRVGNCWLALGLGYGLLMGMARVLQGAHFPSDILGSAMIVYACGYGFSWVLAPPAARLLPADPLQVVRSVQPLTGAES